MANRNANGWTGGTKINEILSFVLDNTTKRSMYIQKDMCIDG
jgi:hypothetical protein